MFILLKTSGTVCSFAGLRRLQLNFFILYNNQTSSAYEQTFAFVTCAREFSMFSILSASETGIE